MKSAMECGEKLVRNRRTFIAKLQILLSITDAHRLKLLVICLLFIIQAALSGTASADTYYVDPGGGSDTTGNGSSSSPWQTIGKAKSVVSAGDIVNLLPGSYGSVTFGESGDSYGTSWNSPIIYRNNPDSPLYSAEFSRIVFRGNHNFYTIISGVDVENSSSSNCICIGGVDVALKDCAYIRIENCRVHGSAGVSGPTNELVYIQSSNNILIEDCEVYDSGSLCWGVNAQDSEYVTVSGCHIHDIARSALRTGGGQYYTFEYNHIHTQRPEWGVDPHGSGISIHSHKTTIRGNIVYDGWNTRTIRFYQSVAGPDGYRDMLVENNVFYDGQNWSEFIDLGDNCVFRNNTFGEYVNMVFAQNANGSGLSLYNNIFAANLQLCNYGASTSDSLELARSKWDAVHEGNNIFTKLVAPGSGYLWVFPEFSATSNSLSLPSLGVGTFFESRSGSEAYKLCEGSEAIDFADSEQAPATDLLGNSRVGPPDAGCYEYGFSPVPGNEPPTAVAGQNQTVIDADGDGYEYVVLDGSLSADPDGTIVSYLWTENGDQIAVGVKPTVLLSSGQHTITLTVIDDGGLPDSDTVTITVETQDNTHPSLVSTTAFENSVEILFSETLHPFSVGDIANYDIDNGISISQATLIGDGDTILLTTSSHTDGLTYTLTCRNIADLAGNIINETVVSYIYSSNLVGWWKFNEAGGLVAQDSSGNGNTGTLINGPLWTDWALTFDGTNDYVTCGNDQTLNFTGSLTISACIRPQSFGQGGWGRIVDKGSNGSTGYSFYLDSPTSAIKYVTYGGNTTSSSAGIIELDKWQHVAVVYDESSATVTFYLDGKEIGTTYYSTAPVDSSNAPLAIGIRGYDLNRAFDGLIDNVRLYNQALDAEEILNLFNEDQPFGFRPIGDKQVDENSNLTFEVITQLPNIVVELYDHTLPSEPAFTENIFSWTPTYDDAGSYEVTFRATQDELEEFETIIITVNNINGNPVLESIGDKSVIVNTALTFTVNASDPDGDSVSYTADNLPDGAAFTNKTFTWTPDYDQGGIYEVTFIASDGQGQDSQTILITVIDFTPNTDGLVGYWKFDELSGTTAADSSGLGNSATLVNSPTWTTGKVDGALSFNGENTYVNCGTDSSLNMANSLTICAWIYPESFGQGGWGRIVDRGNGSSGYSFYLDSANNVIKYVAYGNNTISSLGQVISVNNWQHVAVVYDDSSGTVTFYVNGQQAGTTGYTVSPLGPSDNPAVIGIRGYDLSRAFDGLIDDVRIYNRALRPDEISDMAPPVEEPSAIIIDNGDENTSYTGIWSISGGTNPYGDDSLWSRDGSTYTWTFSPTASASYELSMWWTDWESRCTNVPVDIEHSGGTTRVYINQQLNGGRWNTIGRYFFEAGMDYDITIIAQPAPLSTCADAVRVAP
jgi:hypothetical protein